MQATEKATKKAAKQANATFPAPSVSGAIKDEPEKDVSICNSFDDYVLTAGKQLMDAYLKREGSSSSPPNSTKEEFLPHEDGTVASEKIAELQSDNTDDQKIFKIFCA